MPILNVKVSGTRSDELTRDIARTLVEITARVLGKNPALTAVTISYVDPRDWIVGGRSLAEQGKNSFYFDIKVVDETNTKAQKAEYVREAFEAFGTVGQSGAQNTFVSVRRIRPRKPLRLVAWTPDSAKAVRPMP
jgi:4-oxalocrotonate tautomerase